MITCIISEKKTPRCIAKCMYKYTFLKDSVTPVKFTGN